MGITLTLSHIESVGNSPDQNLLLTAIVPKSFSDMKQNSVTKIRIPRFKLLYQLLTYCKFSHCPAHNLHRKQQNNNKIYPVNKYLTIKL